MLLDPAERPRELSGLRWVDLPESTMVLVPIGSTEQHGPHLPLDTDSVIAAAAASAAGVALLRRGLQTVIAPTVAYGASGEHQEFPGTVSIGHEALLHLLVELGRSTSLWSTRIVFVNAHGGNWPTVQEAALLLRNEGRDVLAVACTVPGGDAHAGRTETSLMLHLSAGSVDRAAAEAGNTTPIATLMPDLFADGVRRSSPSGVLGDPAGASTAEGAALFKAMVERLLAGITPEADARATDSMVRSAGRR